MGTPFYFYTPLFTDEGGSQPGLDVDSSVEALGVIPTGMNVLKYDPGLARCVIKVPYGTARRNGWLPKHAGEVLTDYPDLSGVE